MKTKTMMTKTKTGMMTTTTTKKSFIWYLKWVATFGIVGGLALRSFGIQPTDLFVTALGCAIYFYVGLRINEPTLVIINALCFLLACSGIYISYF